jgi:hypothetical protein
MLDGGLALLLRVGTQAGRPTGAKASGRETCLGLRRARACQSTHVPRPESPVHRCDPALHALGPRAIRATSLAPSPAAANVMGPLPNRRTLVQRSTGICLLWSGLGSSTNHHTHRTLTGKQMCQHSEGAPPSSVDCGRPPHRPAVSARVQGQQEFQHSSIIKRAGGNLSGLSSRKSTRVPCRREKRETFPEESLPRSAYPTSTAVARRSI